MLVVLYKMVMCCGYHCEDLQCWCQMLVVMVYHGLYGCGVIYTADRDIFAGKIFHLLIFHGLIFVARL